MYNPSCVECPDGGIGRRKGLKIPGPLPVVRVQVSLWAPQIF